MCGADIPLPRCTICGGDLYEVKDDVVSKSYLFTGLKCIYCENRQSGSFKLLETSCDS